VFCCACTSAPVRTRAVASTVNPMDALSSVFIPQHGLDLRSVLFLLQFLRSCRALREIHTGVFKQKAALARPVFSRQISKRCRT